MNARKRMIILCLCLFLLSFGVLNAFGEADKLSVLRPLPFSTVEGELTAIVFRVADPRADTVRISINGRETEDIKIEQGSETDDSKKDKGRETICVTRKLDMGPNEITITLVAGWSETASRTIKVFYRADLSSGYRVASSEYSKDVFHTAANEAACSSCHKLGSQGQAKVSGKIDDSPCYSCHKKMTAYSNVHGPAARWECLACHNENSKPFKYATQKPDRELCIFCHEDRKEAWAGKKYVHGPTATGKCTICHNPHASDNDLWLRKKTFDLCVTCHVERATGTHVVVGYGTQGSHPLKDVPDPIHIGKEFSCASCHNPHASNSSQLFQSSAKTTFQLCVLCHKK